MHNFYMVVENASFFSVNILKLLLINFFFYNIQASQKGLLGITLNSDWFVPVSKEKADRDAAQRALDFMFGW